MKNRGLGFVFQPRYRDKKTGGKKFSAIWWISYSVHGQRHKESSRSDNRANAVRLLKQRITEAGLGRPIGPQVERTTLDELAEMVFADYRANRRRSLNRVEDAFAHLRRYFRGDCKTRDITSDRVTRYKAARINDDHAANATINYELAMLRRGFRLGAKAQKVAVAPAVDLLKLNNVRKGFRIRRIQVDTRTASRLFKAGDRRSLHHRMARKIGAAKPTMETH